MRRVIAGLRPRPGRQCSTDVRALRRPDVCIPQVGDRYFVVPRNDDDLPKAEIGRFYRARWPAAWQQRLRSEDKPSSARCADSLVQQRQRTIPSRSPSRSGKFNAGFTAKRNAPEAADAARRRRRHPDMRESTSVARDDDRCDHAPRGHLRAVLCFGSGIAREVARMPRRKAVSRRSKTRDRLRGSKRPHAADRRSSGYFQKCRLARRAVAEDVAS